MKDESVNEFMGKAIEKLPKPDKEIEKLAEAMQKVCDSKTTADCGEGCNVCLARVAIEAGYRLPEPTLQPLRITPAKAREKCLNRIVGGNDNPSTARVNVMETKICGKCKQEKPLEVRWLCHQHHCEMEGRWIPRN